MDEDRQIGWLMVAIIGAMGLIVLALIYLPDIRPQTSALECDARGGVWSSEKQRCRPSDSPLAGTAA
ncbi:MAG: hypothetical protein AAF371_18915 [Pseudomonadota bacterium]